MTREEVQTLKVGDRIVWASPHPRARRLAGTIIGRGPTFLKIQWDDPHEPPVYGLNASQFLSRET